MKRTVKFKKALSKSGIKGYKSNYKIIGKPDVAFPKRKVAIFIDGDFWHGYNWKKLGKAPPKKYWQAKIMGNIKRDKKCSRALKKDGWKVMRFWEHEINSNVEKCLAKVQAALQVCKMP